ncbi:MAG: IscS subfamily cysteine desulfurase [Rickettsiales bacterium]|nr:IscS subfamily cysteine desulfurase [Rickettsiales bacterium]
MDKNIYFDYQSTTPLDSRVLDAMMPAMTTEFGNSSSKTHAFGWNAEKMVETARQQLADVIDADAKDIIFTSGATESNNLAIKGVARFNSDEKNHIITTKIEHKCVLEACKYLNLKEKIDVTYLSVDKEGLIDLDELRNAITDKTVLVSVMAVNNEIGVIQDLKSIGEICRERNVYFHTDGAQAFGKIPLNMNGMNIDLMSISGHKIYGPKGVGALYVRRSPRVRIEPIIHGGGQERGLRSGTAPVFLIVGMGAAAVLAKKEMDSDATRINKFAQEIINEFTSMDKVYLNGSEKQRWFGCLNFTFSGIEGESIIMGLKNIAVSSGSACTSADLEPSYVIKAIGVGDDLAHSSIRIGLGRFTTEEEVKYLIQKVKKVVEHLRNISPLWEMMENGVDLKTVKWVE